MNSVKDAALKTLFPIEAMPFDAYTESERLRLREERANSLPEYLIEEMQAALLRSYTRSKKSFPALLASAQMSNATDDKDKEVSTNWGPFLPWHFDVPSSIPALTLAVNSPHLTLNEAHTDRVNRDEVLGEFCGKPIFRLDVLGMEIDRDNEVFALCGPARPYLVWYDLYSSEGTQESYVQPGKYFNPEYGTSKQSTHNNVPAEILPGEKRCDDGIIRRLTTTEVVGYDTYHNQEAIEAGQQHVGLEAAREAADAGSVVYWRPNRATLEVYKVGTELPCLPKEPEPFALVLQGGAQ